MEYKMTKEKADHVYDVLVMLGGADETMRDNFIHHHTEGCLEWRFSGKLGFGGKYRSYSSTVDCYWEDSTPDRLNLINKINDALKIIQNNF